MYFSVYFNNRLTDFLATTQSTYINNVMSVYFSWFQTFSVFWMLCAFFWVIPLRILYADVNTGYRTPNLIKITSYMLWNSVFSRRLPSKKTTNKKIRCCMLSFGLFPGVWILYADVNNGYRTPNLIKITSHMLLNSVFSPRLPSKNDKQKIRCCMLSFGLFPGVWILNSDVSEHSVPSS